MTNRINIKPEDWFDTRELSWAPAHFTRCPQTVSKSSKIQRWITENTQGRYSFHVFIEQSPKIVSRECLYFEDPQEALLFSLWHQQEPDLF
jgi:hypothetical protein